MQRTPDDGCGRFDDVRMRGFRERATVGQVCEWLDARCRALNSEEVSPANAFGRVLASPVIAALDVPPFDRSAMDGFALRGTETNGAGDYNPLTLRLVGQSLPGLPFDGEVIAGTAIRIMTGAPMPNGADAVLPAEFAREVAERVEFTAAIAPGRNVGRRGEDVAAGQTVLESGRRLRPQDVGLLASTGIQTVFVVKRPRVRVLVTGNELAAPGDAHQPFQIFDSNSPTLRALIERDGGVLESSRLLIDDRALIAAALTEPGADIILVSGGSSVGAEDHAPSVLSEVGALPIHGVAMRPSSPTGIGHIGDVLVFLLPGNPVSCLCAYDFFAGRAIRKLGGRSSDWPYVRQRATVGSKIVSAVGRVDYCRVRLESNRIEPISTSGASILSSTTRAAGFVIVPGDLEGYAPGTEVDVFLYDPLS